MTALYIVLIVAAVILLVLLIPADCVIDVSYDGSADGTIFLKYAFVKIKLYPPDKTEKKAVEAEEKHDESDEKNTPSVLKLAKAVYTELKDDILKLISHTLSKTIRIKELNVSSRFGTGDAMYTGIALGAANAAVYNFIALTDRNMQLDKWNVSLDADFDKACLAAGIYCRIRTRGLYILKLAAMAAAVMIKIKKLSRRISKDV